MNRFQVKHHFWNIPNTRNQKHIKEKAYQPFFFPAITQTLKNGNSRKPSNEQNLGETTCLRTKWVKRSRFCLYLRTISANWNTFRYKRQGADFIYYLNLIV